MKIREDFVTNSSSSSFIAVFGKAVDIEKAKESLKNTGLEMYAVTGQELKEDFELFHKEHSCTDWCWVDPFPKEEEIDENGLYFIYSDCQEVGTNDWGEILEEEVDAHQDYVSEKIEKLEGFELHMEAGSGRDG